MSFYLSVETSHWHCISLQRVRPPITTVSILPQPICCCNHRLIFFTPSSSGQDQQWRRRSERYIDAFARTLFTLRRCGCFWYGRLSWWKVFRNLHPPTIHHDQIHRLRKRLDRQIPSIHRWQRHHAVLPHLRLACFCLCQIQDPDDCLVCHLEHPFQETRWQLDYDNLFVA